MPHPGRDELDGSQPPGVGTEPSEDDGGVAGGNDSVFDNASDHLEHRPDSGRAALVVGAAPILRPERQQRKLVEEIADRVVVMYRGQKVEEGDLLAQIDPRSFQVQLDQALGQQKQNEAQLQNAQRDLKRYQTLFKQNSIARQQVDAQAALVQQFLGSRKSDQAAVDNAKLQLSFTRRRNLPVRVDVFRVSQGRRVVRERQRPERGPELLRTGSAVLRSPGLAPTRVCQSRYIAGGKADLAAWFRLFPSLVCDI